MRFNTINEAAEYLYSRSGGAMKLGLKNIQDLTRRLGHPENDTPAVHIAGTNGKGSTASIFESVLRVADYRSGLYTSPHLIDLRERIQIRGDYIGAEDFLDLLNRMYDDAEASEASFFEIMTAAAFCYFKEKKADIAVYETGLGGRLDATNVVDPVLSVITSISKDHTGVLGARLKLIASEKAGIMKPGRPCVIGPVNKTLRAHLSSLAEEKNTPLFFTAENVRITRIRLAASGTIFDARTKTFFTVI
jgi:dihydrofolate synthase / folylpolyglutamate synthase